MIDIDATITIGLSHSTFDRSSSSFGDPDRYDLDRLAASLHHLELCCCQPGADEAGDHLAFEPMGEHK